MIRFDWQPVSDNTTRVRLNTKQTAYTLDEMITKLIVQTKRFGIVFMSPSPEEE